MYIFIFPVEISNKFLLKVKCFTMSNFCIKPLELLYLKSTTPDDDFLTGQQLLNFPMCNNEICAQK